MDQKDTYVVVGDVKHLNDRETILKDAYILGHYMALNGFVLKTMGITELEHTFISGCIDADGERILFGPEREYVQGMLKRLEDDIRQEIPIGVWDRATHFRKSWYTALYCMTLVNKPDAVFKMLGNNHDDGMMIDMNETRYFDLGDRHWMNYLLEIATGMDQL